MLRRVAQCVKEKRYWSILLTGLANHPVPASGGPDIGVYSVSAL
jgi:hypothetical protein